ncbi:Bgt-170 [Blumeria graminis f. sp. tritici]|uniref:Bgt-170 n=2 Tax=Blumeria graminis f. sp. tritici TaxID=62690 RepID=A0A9X9MNX1_BLUGR|nr:Bgt-170 [Blumeria graminis f. sp. tritici]
MDTLEEDQDVKLQLASASLISDLHASLHPLLWEVCDSGERQLRKWIRNRDLSEIHSKLDAFQESPQLLDPHLEQFVCLLADSFLICLQTPLIQNSSISTQNLFIPVYKAISRLLYRFCKVRGEKIIVQLFSTEVRHIELLQSALEKWAPKRQSALLFTEEASPNVKELCWEWEEIYITMLWLSQLLLVPFDLASISSDTTSISQPDLLLPALPVGSPDLVTRIIPLAIHYLSTPGKEKDAAKYLLVRLSTRRDMLENSTTSTLINWAISQLRPNSNLSVHHILGVLSFLAGLLASSVGTGIMQDYLLSLFEASQVISSSATPLLKMINDLSVARKLILKIYCRIALISLQDQDNLSNFELVEGAIGHMLDSISDAATPVRLATSKALSIITSKLPPSMANEVVDDLLAAMKKNILWTALSESHGQSHTCSTQLLIDSTKFSKIPNERKVAFQIRGLSIKTSNYRKMDASRVNSLEWHGLIMTLSHLIYRRSIPPHNLSPVLAALQLGLTFEQTSTSGSSVGINVRDAACFGLWALARRYTTAELQGIVLEKNLETLDSTITTVTTLQQLASELATSATIDSVGNIRRGSSAALQELVGRHPDTVEKGIDLIQVIDYHSIALGARAIGEVALNASLLSDHYYTKILEGLLGWRGIRNSVISIRRVSANTIGEMVSFNQLKTPNLDTESVMLRFSNRLVLEILRLDQREAHERHGLIISFTALIKQFQNNLNGQKNDAENNENLSNNWEYFLPQVSESNEEWKDLVLSSTEMRLLNFVQMLIGHVMLILREITANQAKFRAPKLTAEAVGQLISSGLFLIFLELAITKSGRHRADFSLSAINDRVKNPLHENCFLKLSRTFCSLESSCKGDPSSIVELHETILEAYDLNVRPPNTFMRLVKDLLDRFLRDADEEIVDVVSTAAASYGLLCGPENGWFHKWQEIAFAKIAPERKGNGRAYILTILKFPVKLYESFCETRDGMKEKFHSAIYSRWHSRDDIDTRVIIMRYLARSFVFFESPTDYIDLIKAGLDDYTITSQGDVGSLLRIESIRTAATIWNEDFIRQDMHSSKQIEDMFDSLMPRILRLASSKLDRLRLEAKKTLLLISRSGKVPRFCVYNQLEPLSTSSKVFFRCLLDTHCSLFPPQNFQHEFNELIADIAVSAETATEEVVCSSRYALVEFCLAKDNVLNDVFDESAVNNESFVFKALIFAINSGVERFTISGIEVLAFLISGGILHQQALLYFTPMSEAVDKVLHQSKIFKKIVAGIKLFGALLDVDRLVDQAIMRSWAINRLTSNLIHRYPKIRALAVDELFFRTSLGRGVDWLHEKKLNDMLAIRQCLLEKHTVG